MVLKLDGNSEMGAHVWSEISNLICLGTVLDKEKSQF